MIIDKLISLQANKLKKTLYWVSGFLPEQRKKTKISAQKKTQILSHFLGFIIGLLVLLSLGFLTIYYLIYDSRIYPYIAVGGIDVSGKTDKEAELIISQAYQAKPKNIPLIFESKSWLLNLDDLSLVYSPAQSAKNAMLVGREGPVLGRIEELSQAFWQKTNLDLDYQLNWLLLDQAMASLSAQIDLPSIPPTIQIVQLDQKGQPTVMIKNGEPGRKLDVVKTKKIIAKNLGQLETDQIILPVDQILPTVTQEMTQKTKERAQNLLGKKLVLNFEAQNWQIDDEELIGYLDFWGGWSEEKMATYTAQLALSIDRPSQNALLRFDQGRVAEFKPAKNGQTLDQKKTQQVIKEALENFEKDATLKTVQVNLLVGLAQPDITTGEVNNLGIKQLIGRGESWFYGSIPGRIHNIKLASDKLNGLLVAPGETFSFNKAIGDISAATGFAQAYIIQSGRTILGDGGGVCQVSTTLFRAILNAGLPIEERHAHAYRVSYYEYNGGPGFDATVYYPSEDLKFKNDTPGHILIQTYTNTANLNLRIEFYGSSDGRQVWLSPVRVWDQTPPPPDLYQDDPTLPNGQIKQVDWKAWGAKASFNWKVTRGSEVLQERTFYSAYRPWQAIFLKGTKGN